MSVVDNDGVVATGNVIHKVLALRADGTMPICSVGLLLATDAHGNGFRANGISGEGSHPINLLGTPASPVTHNVFVGNNLTGFSASDATVFLNPFASMNTFAGNSGTVAGNIVENTIPGLTPVAGGIGGEVSGVLQPRGRTPGSKEPARNPESRTTIRRPFAFVMARASTGSVRPRSV